ncbi:MAG: FdtA/QdtA family cupin domain-containing protein [Rhizobacter sp.]|nr:FdtA/QdtA family cupin domain-containing protein [Chlorobiales bacterium]
MLKSRPFTAPPETTPQNSPRLVSVGKIGDATQGYISVIEGEKLMFDIQRVYWIYLSPEDITRGHHAHKELEQIIFAVHGEIEIELENHHGDKHRFLLDDPSVGLFIPKQTWRRLVMLSDAVLVCMASMEYDESDYIRDYNTFKNFQA